MQDKLCKLSPSYWTFLILVYGTNISFIYQHYHENTTSKNNWRNQTPSSQRNWQAISINPVDAKVRWNTAIESGRTVGKIVVTL